MRAPRCGSIFLLLVLLSPSNAKAQGPDDFTIGGFIGDQIVVVAAGLGQCRGATNALNGQIARARAAFWEAYPNGPSLAEARAEFQRQLATKDYMMLMLLLMMEGQRDYEGATADDVTLMDFIVRMCGGLPDGGVVPGAGLALRSWIEAVQAHAPNVMGFSLANREVLADPAAVEAYQAYTRVRDRMELYRGPDSPFRTASSPIQKARAWVGMHYLDAPEGEADVFHRMLRQALGAAAADRALMEFSHVTPAWLSDEVNDSLHEVVSTTSDPVAYRSASILLNDIDGRELRLSELNARLVQRYSEQELEQFARSMMELHAGRCRNAHCFERILDPGTTPEQYVAGYRAFLEEQRGCGGARPFEPGMTPPAPADPEAWEAQIERSRYRDGGRVVLTIMVRDQPLHAPRVVAVDTSSGDDMVDQLASAVTQFTLFHPATLDGEAIAVCYPFAVEIRPVDEDEIARVEQERRVAADAPLRLAHHRDLVHGQRDATEWSEERIDAAALRSMSDAWRQKARDDFGSGIRRQAGGRTTITSQRGDECHDVLGVPYGTPWCQLNVLARVLPDMTGGADQGRRGTTQVGPDVWYQVEYTLLGLEGHCDRAGSASVECGLHEDVARIFARFDLAAEFGAAVEQAVRSRQQASVSLRLKGVWGRLVSRAQAQHRRPGEVQEADRIAARQMTALLDALASHCGTGPQDGQQASICRARDNEAEWRGWITGVLGPSQGE